MAKNWEDDIYDDEEIDNPAVQRMQTSVKSKDKDFANRRINKLNSKNFSYKKSW